MKSRFEGAKPRLVYIRKRALSPLGTEIVAVTSSITARCLDRDFTRVCIAIKLLMIHSQVDRPDLFSLLLRKRVWFLMGLLSVEFRLALHACGLGTVDVRNLLGSLDSMHVQMRELVVIAQPSAA
jgi:hypothetical protein